MNSKRGFTGIAESTYWPILHIGQAKEFNKQCRRTAEYLFRSVCESYWEE